jgi:hypothetical protein
MELIADDTFGLETVTVAGERKVVDVCGLADALYDAMQAVVPDDVTSFKETQIAGQAAADVFVRYGFPAVPVPAAAYMFAARVCVRAADLKKAVGDVWRSSAEPASPEPTPDSTSGD